MAELEQGASAPDDASLFSDATSTTLEKFENEGQIPPPPPPKPVAEEKKPAEGDPPKGGEPPKPPEDPMVPTQRLREATEARQRVERERDELLRQLAATRTPPPPQQAPPPRPDLFENPSGFVQYEVKPYFEQIQQAMRMQTEAISEQTASTVHGADKVASAKQALTEGMHRGDPGVRAVWEQAMQSAHPYDLITRWHKNQELVREVGGDVAAYKQRIREEAMNDPEFQRQSIERQRNGGNLPNVARPATSSVPRIPSLGNVGAGSDTADLQEPSDDQLFRAAVTARRK